MQGSVKAIRPKHPGDGTTWCNYCKSWKVPPCTCGDSPGQISIFDTSRPLSGANNNAGVIWCATCKAFRDGPCVFHTNAILDQPILPFAYATIPKELEIDCKSDMIQKGVFTKVSIQKPTVFGPLVAQLTDTSGPSIRYYLKMSDERLKFYRLESDHHCNWMKFVRPADASNEANLLAFQQNDQVYFVSFRPLYPNDELRVGYLPRYASALRLLPCNSAHTTPDAENESDDDQIVSDTDEPSERTKSVPKKASKTIFSPYSFLPGLDDNENAITSDSTVEPSNDADLGDRTSELPSQPDAADLTGIADATAVRGPATAKTQPQEPLRKRVPRNGEIENSSFDSSQLLRLRRKRPIIRAALNDPGASGMPESEAATKIRSSQILHARLQSVINVNPYQFRQNTKRYKDAWTEAHDRLDQTGLVRSLTDHNLKRYVIHHVGDYQARLAAVVTDKERVQLKQDNPLLDQLAEMIRLQPKHVGTGSSGAAGDEDATRDDLLEFFQIIWQANPYQYHMKTKQYSTCWHDVFASLLTADLVENELPETGLVRVKVKLQMHLARYRAKVEEAAQAGQEVYKPETSQEVVLNDLLAQRKACPGRSERKKRSDNHDWLGTLLGPKEKLKKKKKSDTPSDRPKQKKRTVPKPKPSGAGADDKQRRSEREGYVSQFWKYRCDVCPAEFRNAEVFALHGVKHGKIADTSVISPTCPACSVTHETLDALMVHIERHERRPSIYIKKTKFRCEICLRHYSSQLFLDRHVRRLHTEIGSERTFECKTCSKKYITLAALKSHERVHSARKFFECPVCLFGTPDAGTMQEHSEGHRGADGLFACRICARTYPEFYMIRRHLRQQHTNKTFNCPVCQKVFNRDAAVKKHMLVHEAHFAYQCDTCGRKFKRKENHVDHIRRLHNPDRQYKMKERSEKVAKAFATAQVCEFCTRQYANKERLLIHQREKHLEKMPLELRYPSGETVKTRPRPSKGQSDEDTEDDSDGEKADSDDLCESDQSDSA